MLWLGVAFALVWVWWMFRGREETENIPPPDNEDPAVEVDEFIDRNHLPEPHSDEVEKRDDTLYVIPRPVRHGRSPHPPALLPSEVAAAHHDEESPHGAPVVASHADVPEAQPHYERIEMPLFQELPPLAPLPPLEPLPPIEGFDRPS